MKDYSTLQKETARALEMATNRTSRKPQKIAKKSLNDAFSSVSEDTVAEISNELVDLSPFSEISDVNQNGDTGNSLLAVDPTPSLSPSESSILTNIYSSEVFTAYKKESSVSLHGSYKFNGEKTRPALTETTVNLIQQAHSQVLKSVDVDSRSKRFLDALIKIIIDDFLVVPEEKDLISEIVSAKSHFVFLWFLLLILVLGLIFFFSDGTGSCFSGPMPT